jgi:hypothetical protein
MIEATVKSALFEVSEILPLVIESMALSTPPCYRDGLRKTFDEATRTYRAIIDFVFNPSSEETS